MEHPWSSRRAALGGCCDIASVMALIPHRYPILLIDRVVDDRARLQRATGIKNVTINEPFFPGHFPPTRSCPGCCWSRRWRRPRPCW